MLEKVEINDIPVVNELLQQLSMLEKSGNPTRYNFNAYVLACWLAYYACQVEWRMDLKKTLNFS